MNEVKLSEDYEQYKVIEDYESGSGYWRLWISLWLLKTMNQVQVIEDH